MILVVAVLAGIVVAMARGGRLERLAGLPLRLGWLAMLCLLAQAYVVFSPVELLEPDRPQHAALMLGSYVALGLVVWANRRITGVSIIGLGLLLNLAVMAANGGFMPVSREAVLTAGIRPAEELPVEGGRLSRSKDVLLPIENTRLWFLSDVIVAPSMPIAKVYSVGDLIVGLGAFILLQAAMLPDQKRRLREGDQVSAA